ncbi:MAG: gliding motility protein GldN, partial [Saprospiraceae bacterium]|nr:gliding motility protein GldN [Saprospiraceae bacterium]
NLLSNRAARLLGCLGGATLLSVQFAFAQDPEPLSTELPMDDITERDIVKDRSTLPYQPIREADILWEKRIWRVVDVREKMNLPFTAPESPLFKIFSDAALAGDLQVYSTEDDKFSKRLKPSEIRSMLFRRDTIVIIEPESFVETVKVVENEINLEDVKRFRIKESWFFDSKTSTLRSRILGIAPSIEERDENGNFKYEMPLFWVYYPAARPLLAQHKAITHGDNFSATTTWEDLFEKRYFASYITKENNVRDLRLQDLYTGLDLLMESDKIKNELFAREHDMWSY